MKAEQPKCCFPLKLEQSRVCLHPHLYTHISRGVHVCMKLETSNHAGQKIIYDNVTFVAFQIRLLATYATPNVENQFKTLIFKTVSAKEICSRLLRFRSFSN